MRRTSGNYVTAREYFTKLPIGYELTRDKLTREIEDSTEFNLVGTEREIRATLSSFLSATASRGATEKIQGVDGITIYKKLCEWNAGSKPKNKPSYPANDLPPLTPHQIGIGVIDHIKSLNDKIRSLQTQLKEAIEEKKRSDQHLEQFKLKYCGSNAKVNLSTL